MNSSAPSTCALFQTQVCLLYPDPEGSCEARFPGMVELKTTGGLSLREMVIFYWFCFVTYFSPLVI